ncbi:MAG: M23 family metallopeptidase [Candidatus Limnocylindria bacterium]
MPDLRRLYRRITDSNLPTRVIAHLSVVSLVVAASAASYAGAQGHDGAGPSADPGFLSLVSSVRGAAEPSQELGSTSYSVDALSDERSILLNRAAPAGLPGNEPMPTPVPVDPDATPLPAPVGVGSTGSVGVGGLSNRSAGPSATGGLFWPVPAGSISQYYHAGHLALDIAAPYGSQVVAAQGGTVSWAGWRNNGGGYVISINHGNGIATVYNHLGSIWVSPGQYVSAGQGIGGVGCTGICTGPHVHFEVIVNGVIDNPLRHL